MSGKCESARVMAAGLGKLMRPLTATRPKPLVRVAGKPLIDHSLVRIEATGIGHGVVHVPYLADALEAPLAAHKQTLSNASSDEGSQLNEPGARWIRETPPLTEIGRPSRGEHGGHQENNTRVS